MKCIQCDVAIIGAGPAGLAAALSAHEHGAADIVILERDKYLGGILQQCIHTGFGLSLFGEDLSGPEYAGRFIEKLHGSPIRCFVDTMVIELTADRRILAVSASEGSLRLSPKAVILAMGCRERTRGAIALPGTRPAGIMTAGAAQRMINVEGHLPGREIVILGSGDIGMIMARRLHLEGCTVKAVVEYQSCIGGLVRNLVQCLHDFDIPLYLNHTVSEIHGEPRIRGVDIAPLDDNGRPDTSRAFPVSCDTLLLSVGLIPENELSKQADILMDEHTGGPVVDERYQTSVPGIFAAGNVVQVFDLVDHVSRCGMRAGRYAASYARVGEGERRWKGCRVLPGEGIRCVVPQRLSGEHGVDTVFHLRTTQVFRKASLQLLCGSRPALFKKTYSIVRPPEMITAEVKELKTGGRKAMEFRIREAVR